MNQISTKIQFSRFSSSIKFTVNELEQENSVKKFPHRRNKKKKIRENCSRKKKNLKSRGDAGKLSRKILFLGENNNKINIYFAAC